MRVLRASATLLIWLSAAVVLFGIGQAGARAQDIKLEVQLVWASNDNKSPDAKHKPVEADIRKKLQELPLKWTNYFMVKREWIEVPVSASKKASLSEKCAIEVTNVGHSKIQVSLFGKGEQVLNRSQSMPKGEVLVLGGNAPNATAWLVVLKRKD